MKAKILYGEKKVFIVGEWFSEDKKVTSIEVKNNSLVIGYECVGGEGKGILEFYNTPFLIEKSEEGHTALDDIEKAFL